MSIQMLYEGIDSILLGMLRGKAAGDSQSDFKKTFIEKLQVSHNFNNMYIK